MQRVKTSSRKRVRGQAWRPTSMVGQQHFAPKNSGIVPKFPYKALNSPPLLILQIWKENFEKKIWKKEILI
jgi:hypothetical protein